MMVSNLRVSGLAGIFGLRSLQPEDRRLQAIAKIIDMVFPRFKWDREFKLGLNNVEKTKLNIKKFLFPVVAPECPA